MDGIFLSEPPLGCLLDDLDGLLGPGGALQNRSAAPPDCVYRQSFKCLSASEGNAVSAGPCPGACQMVVLGAPGPFDHRPVLLKLLARRWLDWFGAVPAGRQFIAETAERMVFEAARRSVDFDRPRSWTWSRVQCTGTGWSSAATTAV
jgi:hypothetical protein